MKKGNLLYNNYFGLALDEHVEVESAVNTLLIRKKEFDFYRLYVISRDEDELESMLSSLKGNVYVINIPSKTRITNWDNLLTRTGFSFLDVYSRYYNNNIKSFPSTIDTFAREEDLEDIASLLYNNFSIYTDHLPERDELLMMISNKQIITDYKDGRVCGVLIFTIRGNKGYQNAWIDLGDNALALLFKVKSIFIEHRVIIQP